MLMGAVSSTGMTDRVFSLGELEPDRVLARLSHRPDVPAMPTPLNENGSSDHEDHA